MLSKKLYIMAIRDRGNRPSNLDEHGRPIIQEGFSSPDEINLLTDIYSDNRAHTLPQ